MKMLWRMFLLACIAGVIAPVMAQEPAPPAQRINLRIYYAGHPKSDRERDFVEFLKIYFVTVDSGDLAQFDGSQSKNSDVVIIDYDADDFKGPRSQLGRSSPGTPRTYKQPTIMIGITGCLIAGSIDLKTGYQ